MNAQYEERISKHIEAFVDSFFKPINRLQNENAEYDRKVRAAGDNIHHRIEAMAQERGWHMFTREGNALHRALSIIDEEFELLDGVNLQLGGTRNEH